MLKSTNRYFLLITMFVASICAAETEERGSRQLINTDLATENALSSFFNFFNKSDSTIALKEEIHTLKIDLERLESQQKQILDLLNASLNETKAQKDRMVDSEELQHILIKYGNNPDGMSALHYAIKLGDVQAVEFLIANGADLYSTEMNFRPQAPFNTLMRAASFNQTEIMSLLIALGADVNSTPFPDCNYPIYYAAESGSNDMIKLLIENGATLDKLRANDNQQNAKTPLHVACKAGNFDAVVALVNGGAKINGNFPHGIGVQHHQDGTPLDWAIHNLKYGDNPRNLELVKFLVEHGANRGARGSTDYIQCPVIKGYIQGKGR